MTKDPTSTTHAAVSTCVLAFVSLAVAMQQGYSPAPAAALLGMFLLALVFLKYDTASQYPDSPIYLGSLLSLGVLWVAAPSYRFYPHPPDLPILAFGVIPVGIGLWLEVRPQFDHVRTRAFLVAATCCVALIGAALIIFSHGQGMDILFLHKEAAAAIADGFTPYGPAVNVANWAPAAGPDARIIGYPYPPVIALVFSIGEWLFGDPRWGGLASWLLTLGVLAGWGVRVRSKALVRFVLFLMLIPWPLLVLAGFTESVTVALLVLAAYRWHGSPVASSIFLGLALSTKQYLLVLLPIILLAPMMKWRRTFIALGITAVALIPALFPDPALAWDALVSFHADTLPRIDSPNLVGLMAYLGYWISIPPAIPLILALMIATVTGRTIDSPRSLFAAMALTLSVFFFLINQTNANYWLLILGLLVLVKAAETDSNADQDRAVGRALGAPVD